MEGWESGTLAAPSVALPDSEAWRCPAGCPGVWQGPPLSREPAGKLPPFCPAPRRSPADPRLTLSFQSVHSFSGSPVPWGPLCRAMASCHSLLLLDGKIQGDPLELKMFEGTNWVSTILLQLLLTLEALQLLWGNFWEGKKLPSSLTPPFQLHWLQGATPEAFLPAPPLALFLNGTEGLAGWPVSPFGSRRPAGFWAPCIVGRGYYGMGRGFPGREQGNPQTINLQKFFLAGEIPWGPLFDPSADVPGQALQFD